MLRYVHSLRPTYVFRVDLSVNSGHFCTDRSPTDPPTRAHSAHGRQFPYGWFGHTLVCFVNFTTLWQLSNKFGLLKGCDRNGRSSSPLEYDAVYVGMQVVTSVVPPWSRRDTRSCVPYPHSGAQSGCLLHFLFPRSVSAPILVHPEWHKLEQEEDTWVNLKVTQCVRK